MISKQIVIILLRNRQQAKLFEERMSNVFGGAEGAPSGDQINLTFQKMAGTIYIQFSFKTATIVG